LSCKSRRQASSTQQSNPRRPRFELESELGVNPYKFGMIGSTDAHTGLAAVEEDNFFGKTSSAEPSPGRANHPFVKTEKAVIMGWETTASGYAAVWASENTREAIFDAMERRETYATTGPRMLVRFFGGYDFTAADANTRSPAVIGYTKGIPMGGDLEAAPAGKVPSFLVAALKDPSAPISTATRLLRVGSMPRARCRRKSTMLPGRVIASLVPTARCLRLAALSTWRTPPGPTP
jgi:hypothetical protein